MKLDHRLHLSLWCSRRNNLPSNPFFKFIAIKFQVCTVLHWKVMTVLVSAFNLFSQCLLYKLIFLVLLLCRGVTTKAFGIWSWNFAEAYNGIWKNVLLCRVLADPVRYCRACGHTKFDYFFKIYSQITFYCTQVWLRNLQKLFIFYLGYSTIKLQYSIPKPKYAHHLTWYSLNPHTLLSQAWSHISGFKI